MRTGKNIGRIGAICGVVLLLGGCAYKNEPVPEIVGSYPDSLAGLAAPKIAEGSKAKSKSRLDVPGEWAPAASVEKKWSAIVIHHSATENGNRTIFDRSHRLENGWDGVGYDFVIGNGTDSGDGEVEVTFRWRQQRTGAHCKTPGNWANEDAVGICLVGNFNETSATAAQIGSVLKLVRFLQKRYGIKDSRIYGHNTTPGARGTDCPGRSFSMSELKAALRR